MELTPEQIENIGKTHGHVEAIREDVSEIKDLFKDVNKEIKRVEEKADKALKETGRIKTVFRTVIAIGASIWAMFTFFVGGK